jgi:hypothetical protein
MTALSSDSLATVVHLHIAELRREAADDRAARTARTARKAARDTTRSDGRRPWPQPVARALRELFARPTTSAACSTC